MKLRRRNHPNRQGQKSPPGNAPQGKRTLAKIMTANANEWINHAGEVVNNAQIQAKVEEATKRHQQWAKEQGVPWWQIKSTMKSMPTLSSLKSESELYEEFKVLYKKAPLGIQAH